MVIGDPRLRSTQHGIPGSYLSRPHLHPRRKVKKSILSVNCYPIVSKQLTLHMKHPILFKYFFNLQNYAASQILQNVLNSAQRIITCPDQDDLRK